MLELIARGVRNAAIAQRLGISLKTVRNLVSSVLTKLQVPDRSRIAASSTGGTGTIAGTTSRVGGTLGH